ncbi:MAG: hypothetical protein WBG69_10455 [Arcobacteraceae bacterium]
METNPTQQTVQSNNTLMYVFLSVSVILLGYIAYLYTTNDMLKKNDLKNKYVLKSDVNFDMLPAHIKSQYVEFYEHTQQVNTLNDQIRNLSKNRAIQTTEPKVIEKIVEVEKIVKVPVEKIVEKIVKVPVEKIVEVEKVIAIPVEVQSEFKEENSLDTNSKAFNTYTCKNMGEGSIKITTQCIKALHRFLDDNKDAKKFEVIGMVDDKDFKLINTLKDVYGEQRIKDLSKYSQIGLSRQRVIEASWLVKEYIGDYKNIKTVNYTVHTKDKKGFVVRAYK